MGHSRNHIQRPFMLPGKPWRRLISSLMLTFSCHHSYKNFHLVESAHVYTDSFPTNDEYDFAIMDPNHIYGSPYGGFGRATPSRIAAMPLRLPDVAVELEDYEQLYVETRDYLGRRYVCRTYHEDEVDPSSLGDSMFDTVKLRKDTASSNTAAATAAAETRTENNNFASTSTTLATTRDAAGASATTTEMSSNTDDSNSGLAAVTEIEEGIGSEDANIRENAVPGGINSGNSFVGGNNDKNSQLTTGTSREKLRVSLVAEVNRRLARLEGICAQIHEGWWSYEWCHQDLILQFHVHVANDATKVSDIQLQDETKLGQWSERRVHVTQDSEFFDDLNDGTTEDGSGAVDPKVRGDDADTDATSQNKAKIQIRFPTAKSRPKPNKYSEGTPELAVVSDIYSKGDVCPETGEPRITQVDLRCCSPRVMNRIKGGVLFNGQPIKNEQVAIHSLSEQPGTVCVYNVTVCTTLLCGDEESGASLSGNRDVRDTKKSNTDAAERPISALGVANVNVEHMSVREILDLTFGKARKICIQSNTGGWWIYEICPGALVRQFHETTLMDRVSGASSTAVDTEHILGKYRPEDNESYPKESEWEHVVNATVLGGGTLQGSPSTYGGNGAYYYQEYTGGDVCDHTDVTDAAIKAGAVGEGGVERASTVRYTCGNRMSLNVKEDSTCHYLVEVSIPALCDHPLFKPPVSKRQILKCLPAEDSLGTLDDFWYV